MFLDHDFVSYPELTNSQLELHLLTSPHPQILASFEAVVVKVHDGDTISLRVPFRDFDFPLRFADINAPELNEGGAVARDWLSAHILNRKVMVLVDPLNRVDKYGRLLGKVFVNGLNVGDEMYYLGLVPRFGFEREGQPMKLDKLLRLKQWF